MGHDFFDVGALGVGRSCQDCVFVKIGDRSVIGDAGPYGQNLTLVIVVHRDVSRHFRTRPDKGHIPCQHINKLWKFVQFSLSQVTAETGDPGIAINGNLLSTGRGVLDHRSELEDIKFATIKADSGLAEKDGAL